MDIEQFAATYLIFKGLKKSSYLLEVGCNELRGGMSLVRFLDPGHYYGFDVRREAIDNAWAAVKKEGLEAKQPVLWYEYKDLDRKFAFVWAFNVLIHLADDRLNECLAYAARHLEPTGKFYANVNEGNETQYKSFLGFYPLVFRSMRFYEQMAEANGLAFQNLGLPPEWNESSPQRMVVFSLKGN